jgi:hypothetical protein
LPCGGWQTHGQRNSNPNLAFLAEYTFDVQHIAVTEELRSDCVSFTPLPLCHQFYAEVIREPPPALMAARFVYVRRGGVQAALAPKYYGPYEVMEHGLKYFVVKMGPRSDKVMVDQLKPHTGEVLVQPAMPPKCGRPPGKPPL